MLLIFLTPALAKEVVNVDPAMKNGFLVEGHSGGTTTILAWTIDGQIREYMIVVSPEDEGQSLLIQRAIGLPNVHVKKIGQKILLTGTVKNQYERNLAIQVASFYLNGNPHVSLSTGSNETRRAIQATTSNRAKLKTTVRLSTCLK